MEDKLIYISRDDADATLYEELQKNTLEQLQRLSGGVWTDYNPHDPGVTVADIANYALTELSYKLGFDLEGYLADEGGSYPTDRYGMFSPEDIYQTSPVTESDWRCLLLAHFPMLDNARMETDDEQGICHFRLRLSPFFPYLDIVERVRCFFHRHRNLCENVGEITIDEPKKLLLKADFEIKPGYDPTDVLVKIYYTCMQYLAGSVKISKYDATEGVAFEDWFDGPVGEVRVTIPKQTDTETELYWMLTKIEGVQNFKSCFFYEDSPGGICEQNLRNDFKDGYMLDVPVDFRDVNVRMYHRKVDINMELFKEKLRTLYFTKSTSRLRFRLQRRMSDSSCDADEPQKHNIVRNAGYHDVYGHWPMEKDLPRCYKTEEKDFTKGMSDADKGAARNFGNYLRLFDLIIERGLHELGEVKGLLSLVEGSANLSRSLILPPEIIAMQKENDRWRDITALKTKYLDYIDGLYGIDSNLEWMQEFGDYGETVDDGILRRMKFLRAMPILVRDRFRSFDITQERGEANISVVKRYLSLLMNMNGNERISVGNILPSHNLILLDEREGEKPLRDRLNAMLIDGKISDAANVIPVEPDAPPADDDEKLMRYETLRQVLPIFNINWISGGLFRGGIDLENYKLVKLEREYLLVFRNKEENEWMNLGRSDDKEKLRGWANTLRRYLQELNRQCETIYIIENNLLKPSRPFSLTIVITGWTARTHSPRFRYMCTQLVRSLIPAHLKMDIHWLSAPRMQYFEESYHRWRDGLDGRYAEDVQLDYQEDMLRILTES